MSDDEYTAIAKPGSLDRWLTDTVVTLNKMGVPESVIRAITPIVMVFGVTGLPAAGVAIMSLFASGFYAAWKQHTFQQAIRQELHGAIGEVEAEVDDVRRAVARLRDTVEDVRAEAQEMASKLSPEQVEQLGTIFEEYMASVDEEWLELLRNATRGVVKNDIDPATRKAVLAHLRALGPAHVLVLRRVAERAGQGDGYGSLDNLRDHEDDELIAALSAAGFVDIVSTLVSMDGLLTIRLTPLGRAALALLCG